MPSDIHHHTRKLANWQKRLLNSRFFMISCLVHLILVVTLGGTVLFSRYIEPPDFTGGEGGSFVSADSSVQAPTEQPQVAEQQPTFDVSTATQSTSLDAITTSAPTEAAFSIPAAFTPTIAPSTTLTTNSAPTPPTSAGTGMPKEVAQGIASFTGGWAKGGQSGYGSSARNREFEFTAYLAKYSGGDWASTIQYSGNKMTEGSLINLLWIIGKLSKDKIKATAQPVPLDLSSQEIFAKKPPFILFTGHRDFTLTETEVQNLQKYVRLGGCIWGDSSLPGLRSRFDIAFRREMRRVIPDKDKDFEIIPLTHPIFSKAYYPEIRDVPPGMNGYREPLYALKYFGEIAIFYTPNDYADMWQFGLTDKWTFETGRDANHNMVAMNDSMWRRRGVYFHGIDEPKVKASYQFGLNIIVHLLTRWEDKVRGVPQSSSGF